MKKVVMNMAAALLLILVSGPGLAQMSPTDGLANNVPDLLVQANKAHEAKDYDRLRKVLERLRQERPSNSEYMYRLVLAHALLDNKSAAYDLMLRMQQQGLGYDFTLTEESRNIRGTQVFDYVNDLMKFASEPAGELESVFSLPADVSMPASLAWDGSRQKFLVGTVTDGQVLAVDENGQVEELLKADNENGMWAVMDILVDEPRQRLWISSAAVPQFRDFSVPDKGRSSLFEFNLETLELIRRYPVPVDGRPHVLGSMLLNADGDIYIADRALPVIYTKRAQEQKLAVVFGMRDMVSLRDIAMQPDGRLLYIADREMGIRVVDFHSKKAGKLAIPETLNLGGIDGLFLWNNHLVIIQNGISPQRVMRLALDSSGTRVEAVRPLAVAQPVFDFPSFGTLKDKELFYFANSQWADGEGQASPVAVVKTALDASEDLVSAEMMLHLEKERRAAALKKQQER